MTLQKIADYAMDYLDSKGIAAEYEIKRMTIPILWADIEYAMLFIEFNGGKSMIIRGESFDSVKFRIDELLSNRVNHRGGIGGRC